MKNFILSVLGVLILSALVQLVAPWWIIAVAGFGIGYFVKQKSFVAFLAGFIGVFLLWSVYAFMLSKGNDNLLAHKVAMLLPLKGHVSALLIVTGLIGGLVAGFASLSGSYAAKLSD